MQAVKAWSPASNIPLAEQLIAWQQNQQREPFQPLYPHMLVSNMRVLGGCRECTVKN